MLRNTILPLVPLRGTLPLVPLRGTLPLVPLLGTLRSLFVLCLLCAGPALPIAGQGLPTAEPGEVGLSPERLARIGETVRGHVDRGELAGAVTLVARHGKVAHFEALGRMDGEADGGVPMRADALFGIASMTKPITSTAVMMLYEEDRFQLGDPVSRYIPALKEMTVAVVEEGHEGPDAPYSTVPAGDDITIRDLLRHTAGFTYDFLDPGPVGELYRQELQPGPGSLGDFVTELAGLPLASQPGTGFVYGHSTDVLGYLVEVVSKQPFERFLTRRIFQPLAMTDTAFYVPEEKIERMTTLYAAGEDGKVHPAVRPYFRGYREPPEAPSGGAGLVSTASDYARFLQMLLNGGRANGVRLLSRKSVELMTTGHLGKLREEGFYPGYDFGLGFAVRVDLGAPASLGSVGEYAWSGLFCTYFFVDPHEQMFALLMTQTSPYDHLDLGSRFKKLVYQAIDD